MTLKVEQEAGLGAAVEQCIEDAWHAWKAQHADHMSHELAWVQEVNQIRTELLQLHAGRVRIRVSLQARQPWKSESYFYQWQEHRGGVLILQAKV